jgi:hypothetical protein
VLIWLFLTRWIADSQLRLAVTKLVREIRPDSSLSWLLQFWSLRWHFIYQSLLALNFWTDFLFSFKGCGCEVNVMVADNAFWLCFSLNTLVTRRLALIILEDSLPFCSHHFADDERMTSCSCMKYNWWLYLFILCFFLLLILAGIFKPWWTCMTVDLRLLVGGLISVAVLWPTWLGPV